MEEDVIQAGSAGEDKKMEVVAEVGKVTVVVRTVTNKGRGGGSDGSREGERADGHGDGADNRQ